jgi:hypothetical protein
MPTYRPDDDWPKVDFEAQLARRSPALRPWVAASPRRALSGDGRTLVVARLHEIVRVDASTYYVGLDPPAEGEASTFVFDLFHAGADGRRTEQSLELVPGVVVESVEHVEGFLRARLTLTEALRVAVELPAATIDVAWPLGANGELTAPLGAGTATQDGHTVHLADLLAAGGQPAGTLALEAAALRRERDEEAARRHREHKDARGRLHAAIRDTWRVEELGVREQRVFERAVARAGLKRHRDLIRRVARPCVVLSSVSGKRRSRIGGAPDLPRGARWPETDGQPWSFLAQVDLAELPRVAGVDLPTGGVLSLFTGVLEPADDVDHRILYTPAGVATAPLPPPAGPYLDDLRLQGSMSLSAAAAVSLPGRYSVSYTHLVEPSLDADEVERYDALRESLAGEAIEEARLLGHPDDYGGQPEARAYFLRAGRPDSRYWVREDLETPEQRAHFDAVHGHLPEVTRDIFEWAPLFYIRSIVDLNLTFWDAGTLNVMIHRADLAARRFDRTVAIIVTG